MEDMERQKFEDDIRKAFQHAEAAPSEGVWNAIEYDLMKVESSKLKNRLVFYKALAAASVAFALTVAGLGYYAISEQQDLNQQLAITSNDLTNVEDSNNNPNNIAYDEKSTLVPDASAVDITLAVPQSDKPQNQSSRTSTQHTRHASHDRNAVVEGSHVAFVEDAAAYESVIENNVNYASESTPVATSANSGATELQQQLEERALPSLVENKNLVPAFAPQRERIAANTVEESTADPVALMLARMNELEKELAKQDKHREVASRERLWTSLGFSAGAFSPTNTSVSSPSGANALMASNHSAASKQARASGTAYSMGVSFGTQVAERWVVQGGLNYMTQMSGYTAEQVVGTPDFQNFKAASLNEFRMSEEALDAKVVTTAPYKVNSDVRFISVPVQAGYLVVNRRVGLQLNAGVSTDVFLQNTIDPQGSGLETSTQGPGQDSPYREFNFSGLMGTELSYRFTSRYRIALNPGLRYPLNSIYKDGFGVASSPVTFDVGLRFKYIFK